MRASSLFFSIVFFPSSFAVDLLSTAMILDLLCRSSSDEALFSKMHAPFSLKPLNLCAGRPWGLALWLLPSVGLTEVSGLKRDEGEAFRTATMWGGGCTTKVPRSFLLPLDLYLLNMLHLGYMLGVLCFKCLVHLGFSVQWSGHEIPLYLVREHVCQGPQCLWLQWLFCDLWAILSTPHHHWSLLKGMERSILATIVIRVETLRCLNFS